MQPEILQHILLDMPALAFFTTYALLVLFWAEIYYQARGVSTDGLRPAFYMINVVLYAVQRTAELDTIELLEHLPALQQLLFRLLGCQPEGAAMYNSVIHCALSIVVGESIKIYIAINICTLNLVDKFFDMQWHDAIRALEIYRRAGQQAARLSKFYDICKRSDFGRGQKFVKIEQQWRSL